MINSVKVRTPILALILFVFSLSAYAQTKVIVIPIFGDDAATKWRRKWASGIDYKKGDLVHDLGSSYIATANHKSNDTNDPQDTFTAWDLVAASGADGLDGAKGDQANTGAKGDDGTDGKVGADGKTVLNGSSVPAGGTGVEGDFYIDTTNDDIYGPKTAGQWGGATYLIGAQGADGAAGRDGIDGTAGEDGATGATGLTGLTGLNGKDGDTGGSAQQSFAVFASGRQGLDIGTTPYFLRTVSLTAPTDGVVIVN